MNEKELTEFIVTDLQRNGPIARAIETYVIPRAPFFLFQRENQHSEPTHLPERSKHDR